MACISQGILTVHDAIGSQMNYKLTCEQVGINCLCLEPFGHQKHNMGQEPSHKMLSVADQPHGGCWQMHSEESQVPTHSLQHFVGCGDVGTCKPNALWSIQL